MSTAYYANNLVWTRSNTTGTLTYGYDLAGLVTSEAQAVAGGTTITDTFGYSGDGLRTSLTVTGEVPQGFTYNSRGQPETISYNGTASWITYDYYLSGERKTRGSPNGTSASYGYDGAGRLSSINSVKVAGSVNLLRQDFGYDSRDRRTYSMRDTLYGDVYVYQADSQLTAFRFGVSRPDLYPNGAPAILDSYLYDENGNRTSRSEGGVGTAYTPNALNEYSAVSGAAISHNDGRGNITQWTGWTYAYDADNRLVSASSSTHTYAFAYDAQGRLAKLTDNGVAEYRYYDGAQLFLRKQANGTLLERIVWGPSPDEAVARWSSYGWHYFHHDPLNSPVVATDGNGAAVERYLYDAYGADTIYDGAWAPRSTTAIGNEWLFTGQEWIAGLGLHNYKNRFYQDDLGRFVQQDPLRFDAGDLNLYRYVRNNTFNASDPSGLYHVAKAKKTDASTVATDGKGGLVVKLGTGIKSGTSVKVIDSIKVHEGNHKLTALNQNNAMGYVMADGKATVPHPAGLELIADNAGEQLTGEIDASNAQLAVLQKEVANPALPASDKKQVQSQIKLVEKYKAAAEKEFVQASNRNELSGPPTEFWEKSLRMENIEMR